MRAAARAALSEHGRARSQRAQLARLRRRVEAPVKTLPFLFEPELGVEARPPALAGGSADARGRRDPRGQGHLHLRRLGRGRQDDDLGGDRDRDGGARAEGLRADDRPGQAARRLARPEGARQRGEAGRPGPVRGAGGRDQGRAVGDDARRQGDLRRAGRPPGARRGVARPGPRTTASTSRSPAPWPARRSTWRWRSCSSCTARGASTCSSSTRRRPATRSTSSTRRNG